MSICVHNKIQASYTYIDHTFTPTSQLLSLSCCARQLFISSKMLKIKHKNMYPWYFIMWNIPNLWYMQYVPVECKYGKAVFYTEKREIINWPGLILQCQCSQHQWYAHQSSLQQMKQRGCMYVIIVYCHHTHRRTFPLSTAYRLKGKNMTE